jgi:hypothetical protein
MHLRMRTSVSLPPHQDMPHGAVRHVDHRGKVGGLEMAITVRYRNSISLYLYVHAQTETLPGAVQSRYRYGRLRDCPCAVHKCGKVLASHAKGSYENDDSISELRYSGSRVSSSSRRVVTISSEI